MKRYHLFIGTLQTYITLLSLSNKYPRLVNFKASKQNDKHLMLQPFVAGDHGVRHD